VIKNTKVRVLSCCSECAWHKDHAKEGKIFSRDEMIPAEDCPIMYHTLYPYFLGAFFHAKYPFNEEGDINVCCPAEYGVDVLVKVRPNDGKFKKEVPSDWRDVIHAEVVAVNGRCDYGYKVGDRIIFPTCMKTRFMCPAGVNNIFPFLEMEIPKCINMKKLRCPDWKDHIYYAIENGGRE